jgi:hypothetical protein
MIDGAGELPAAKPANVAFWADRVTRLDALGLREFEWDLRRQWSAESLAPVLEAIECRRQELAQVRTVPTCVYCGAPCDKPFGWFAVERWERGRLYSRGHVCGAGCLIATAHAQRDRDGRADPITKGLLTPVEPGVDDRVIEGGKEHGAG